MATNMITSISVCNKRERMVCSFTCGTINHQVYYLSNEVLYIVVKHL